MRPSPSAAASCVLMSAEICAADTPSTAGPIASSTRRTPSSRQSKRGRPSIPIRASGWSCSASCANAADEHAPGQRLDRRIAIRRQKQRGADDRDVEQYRREGRDGELPIDVEHAAGQRHQRHEEQVRKDDPDHFRRQLDLARRARESGRERVDEPGRREHADDREHQERHGEQRPDASDQRARLVLPALPAVLREDRDERLREGALGEQPAQDVRQAEGCLEGVHLHAGAEGRGLEALAGKPGDPRQQRHPADRRQRPQQVQRALGRTVRGVGHGARSCVADGGDGESRRTFAVRRPDPVQRAALLRGQR